MDSEAEKAKAQSTCDQCVAELVDEMKKDDYDDFYEFFRNGEILCKKSISKYANTIRMLVGIGLIEVHKQMDDKDEFMSGQT